MTEYSLYDLQTGQFTGRQFTAPRPSDVQANTPTGCGVVSGAHDRRSCRVDLATGQVVAYQPPAPPDDASRTWAWSASASEWQPVPTIAARRAAKWAQIKAERTAREFGPLTWDGSVLQADAESKARLAETHRRSLLPQLLGAPPFSVVWPLLNNTTRTLSAAQVAAIIAALADRTDTVHATARSLRAQIDAATTAAQIDAIVWPG